MPPRSKPRSSPRPPTSSDAAEEQRLQKVLAAAGISSRRECEELIRDGRVEVDRQVVTELGTRVDPARQEIRVDGLALPKPKLVHYVLNKPTGVVSTNRDPAGRPRVVDLVPSEQRLFPIGRLDRGSDGLIIVTNDGELANLLTHPRYGVEKTYAVRVAGQLAADTLRQLTQGVHLAEGLARVSSVRIKRQHKQSTDLEVVLNEGRNREIRRILARVGHKVLKLTRIAIGPLRLGDLPPGAHRRLSPQELRELERTARSTRRGGAAAAHEPRERGSRQRLANLKARSAADTAPVEQGGARSAARPTARPSAGRPPQPQGNPPQKAGKPSQSKNRPPRSQPPRSQPPRSQPPRSQPPRPSARPQQGTILEYDEAAVEALLEGSEAATPSKQAARGQGSRRPVKRPGKKVGRGTAPRGKRKKGG